MSTAGQVVVPKLRFAEFEGDWVEKRLGEITDVTSSKRVYLSDYVESGIPFFRGKEISEMEKGIIPDDILYISQQAYEKFRDEYGAPQSGDILITAVGTLANIFRVRENQEFYFKDGNLIWLRDVHPHSEFLEVCLKYNKRAILLSAIGSSQKALTIVELKKLKLAFPSPPEQKKIAAFLGVVDGKLAALREKEAALTRFKTGLMQALFSQTLRFTRDDEGLHATGSSAGPNAYPDWEEKRLEQIATEKFSNGVFNDPKKIGSGYRLINVKNMYSKGTIDPDSLSRLEIESDEFYKNQASYGDIFFTRSSLVREGIAHSNVLLEAADDITFDGHLIRLRPNIDEAVPLFLYYLLSTDQMRRQFVARGKTGTMTTIGQADIASVLAPIPHLEEQQKIADALSAMDAKIAAVGEQITRLDSFKNGLFQQMFV